MDLRFYYQKIRDAEASIADPFPVIVSRQNNDGGKAGTLTEVTRQIAAKMVVEGTAEVADATLTEAFRQEQADAVRRANEAEESAKLRITVLSSGAIDRLNKVAAGKD